ncbi:MAG: dihydropteroate synthase-like protein [Promethearchaeia archaeon]
MRKINIVIVTGEQSYEIIKEIVQPLTAHTFFIKVAPVSISAFITKQMVNSILTSMNIPSVDLVLLPGFIQWDTSSLEHTFEYKIRKGPEFASDLPVIVEQLNEIDLSTKIPANKLLEVSGKKEYDSLVQRKKKTAKTNISHRTFFVNKSRSDVMIGKYLPPPIIAEIVNCTEKADAKIIRKVAHYSDSGADIIDIGCVSNKANPQRVKEIIRLIRAKFDILISIDSMDSSEILAAVDEDIDLILSLDLSNYQEFLDIPKNIPIVLLPTKINEGFFPKDAETRVDNLLRLTEIMQEHGFRKLIADPLLETPISPGICNSLKAYFLYKEKVSKKENLHLNLPLFFGISNVVELMDIDSTGINGLLASIATELDIGVLFTVEHSAKLMYGVAELKKAMMLNYLAMSKKTPPINQGLSMFKAKGKTSEKIPDKIKTKLKKNVIHAEEQREYTPDTKGYFRIFVDHYLKKIFVLFFDNNDNLLHSFEGKSAEALSKKIIGMDLTQNLPHLNYLGRELAKAEFCLNSGKPYLQDE